MIKKNERETKKRRQQNRKRFGRWIFFSVAIIFAMFIGRFFYIAVFQSVDHVNLKKSVAKLYASKTEIKAQRGTIYDADNQPIAEDTSTYTIYIVLSKTAVAFGKREYLADKDKDKAAKVLSKNLSISYDQVKKVLNPENQDTYQVELGTAGKNISLETKNKIEAANIKGINFTESQARLYPNGTFASQLIGIAENNNGKMVGVMGLESQYNKLLTGVNGVKKFEKDIKGTPIPGSKIKSRKAKNGDNVYTTLDSRLQTYLETLMSQAQSTYHAKEMNAVLMNAKTGAIVAATQRPTFNAQTKVGLSDMWRNTLVEDSFEPGSTMKILTMAAAINSGNYNANATYKSGTYKINGQTVSDWYPSGWGDITYRDAFIRSSNVGMAHLEQTMGAKKWLNYIKRFGLLKSTNSGLSNEVKGSIEYKYPIEQANTAYGQGITVTVFQMLQAFSAVTNNGKMVKPQLVRKIVNPNNGKTVYKFNKKVVGHPIKSSTAKKVLSMMQDVVYNQNGTGSAFKIDGYRIGVKTGTAQISNSTGTGYLKGEMNYIFSVAGVAPANNPKYILYITMKQPTTFAGGTSGQMLASVFNPLLKRALDENSGQTASNTQVAIKNYVGKNATSVKTRLRNNGLLVTAIGSGNKIMAQSETTGSTSLSGERIILITNGEKVMPDLTGWSRGDVVKLGKLLGITFNIEGSGYVSEQSLAANKSLDGITDITVKLK